MATVPPPIFQGVSSYSADFQQVLQRSVQIASLPLQQMQNQLTTFNNQQTALNSLQSTFASLENSIQGLATASQNGISASVSDPAVVSASASPTALPGSYTIEVTSMGSNTTTLSQAGSPAVTDPTTQNINPSTSFTLTVDSKPYTITPSSTSLDSLAAAINAVGAGVQATIVNVGSNSSPDYRLAVTSQNLAPDSIQLSVGSTNLLHQVGAAGSPATYQVAGQGVDIPANSTSNITIAPGVTVNLLEASPGTPVTVTVGQSYSSLENAINGFVMAYNSAADSISAQHGQNAGFLNGDSVIFTLSQGLQQVTQYNANCSGGVNTLADLGLTLDNSGHLNFNPSVLTGQSPAAVAQFLGSISSGGFLQAANNALTSLESPTTGAIQSNLTSVQSEITNQNNLIADQTTQVTQLETNMQQQLASADSSIAMLQQQVQMMTGLFSSLFPNSSSGSSSNSNSVTGIGG